MASKALVALALMSGSLYAEDMTFDAKSLIGIEGGFTNAEVKNSAAAKKKYQNGEAGFKIGAQEEHYRLFLSARYYFLGDEFDKLMTFGIEGQYMFNFSKRANFFVGANGGKLYGTFKMKSEAFDRKFSDIYYGADAGFNIHINETYDVEIGVRYITSNASDTQGGVTYDFDNMTTGYMSLIIKYEED